MSFNRGQCTSFFSYYYWMYKAEMQDHQAWKQQQRHKTAVGLKRAFQTFMLRSAKAAAATAAEAVS